MLSMEAGRPSLGVQPYDILARCADEPGHRALLVFPDHSASHREINEAPRWGGRVDWSTFTIHFANGSEARFAGGPSVLFGTEATLLWFHADVDEKVVEPVNVVRREERPTGHGVWAVAGPVVEAMDATGPNPAPSQVWRHRAMPGQPVVVDHCDGEFVHFKPGGWCGSAFVRTLAADWECIGVETEHGRVMVGERRISDHPTAEDPGVIVERVDHGHVVAVRPVGADFVVGYNAERVATWPRASDPSAHASPHGVTFAAARRLSDDTGMPYDDAIRAVESGGARPSAIAQKRTESVAKLEWDIRPASFAKDNYDKIAAWCEREMSKAILGADMLGARRMPMQFQWEPGKSLKVDDEVTLPDGRTARVTSVDGRHVGAVVTFPPYAECVDATVGFTDPAPHYRCPKCRAATTFEVARRTHSHWFGRCNVCREVSQDDTLISLATSKQTDERTAHRREIDRIISGESKAMRCAVLAALEGSEVGADDLTNIPRFIARMRLYEAGRARGMTVERAALEMLGPGEQLDDNDGTARLI